MTQPAPTAVNLPFSLGTVYVLLDTSQDIYVKYDGPGVPFDTLAGVDIQELSLDENTAVCVVPPLVGFGVVVSVNVVDLQVNVCTFTGRNPYIPGPCFLGSWS